MVGMISALQGLVWVNVNWKFDPIKLITGAAEVLVLVVTSGYMCTYFNGVLLIVVDNTGQTMSNSSLECGRKLTLIYKPTFLLTPSY